MIYVADLEDWLLYSSATTYADDTTTGTSAEKLEEMIRRLEIDVLGVLKFMASNGLIANPKKTSLLILNNGKMKEDNSPLSTSLFYLRNKTR